MMSKRLGEDPESLADLFGLLVECPLHGGNPKHCALRHIRALHLQDRYDWACELAREEAVGILARCAHCMRAASAR